MRFWCQLGSILPPKSTKILKKSNPKSHQNFDRFLLRFFLDFGSVLGAKLEPCWPPFSSQDAPRRVLGRLLAVLGALKTPKDATRCPKMPQDASRPRFSLIFDRCFIDFWSILAWFLIAFFIDVFCSFLIDFLIIVLSIFDGFVAGFKQDFSRI